VVKDFLQLLNQMTIYFWFLFHIENSERFILYCLCGCFIGVAIILLVIIIVLYVEKRPTKPDEDEKTKSDYQIPRTDGNYNDIASDTRCYLPVYRYDGKNHSELYHL
jgi:hypothetical protein